MRMQLVPRAAEADLLDLPWHRSLEAWTSVRLVDPPRGIGRHVVRFIEDAGNLFALKELRPSSRSVSTGCCASLPTGESQRSSPSASSASGRAPATSFSLMF